ncbi:putative fmi2 protein [Cladorrhinum samala]|uniref:Fmi2 protein n=1 Tax=Cladorrhinum samala TaxID=585594 RepID=A0AAV9HLX0_9PEZI|nr:putative fmi2 protein [Cladorrhinum samala]
MEIDNDFPMPIAPGVSATAPFTARPPSPPYIHVPTITERGQGTTSISIAPSFSDVDSSQLTEADLRLITSGGALQSARDSSNTWKYESRRLAQPIVDFLYLGPSSVVRDQAFLRSAGITLLLAIRDARFEGMFANLKKTADAVGIDADAVDIIPGQDLIKAFGVVVKKINEHLLRVYRSGQENGDGSGKKGKVLICCETGNDRSALMAAAYIMTVFGLDLVTTVQFMTLQRFCVTFGDDSKFLLQTYEDILRARRDVSRARGEMGPETGDSLKAQIKRRVEELNGGGMADGEGNGENEGDEGGIGDAERFQGRAGFAPYSDDFAQ